MGERAGLLQGHEQIGKSRNGKSGCEDEREFNEEVKRGEQRKRGVLKREREKICEG